MSAALRSFACLLLAGCAPDRFYLEGSHGWGALEPSFKDQDFDVEMDAVTAGLGWDLPGPQERVGRCSGLDTPPAPAPLTAQSIAPGPTNDDDGVPWESLILLASGALGGEGIRRGAPAVAKKLRKRTLVT